MFSLRRAMILAVAAGAVWAQPALTTIQDTLYRANGTRFTGTIFITWNSFQAGDTSNIATSNITLPIVNGVLSVQLVPTTTASAGAQYNVSYNSNGINQFTEVWAVPPSAVPLRVRDVRVSTGTIVGPPPVTSPVQLSDVVGLINELSVRPQKGIGFGIGRTAVINSAGQIDAASGNLSDCVRVDGSSGPCGGAGSGGIVPSFADSEIPAGLVNGVNQTFTLTFTPSPASSLELFRNGLRQESGTDYQVSANTVTFFLASVPQSGDLLQASYRYANPSNPLGSLTSSQVVCSSTGSSTSAAISTRLGTCTIPAGLLGAGDRLDIEYQYGHTGTASGFTAEVHVGTTTVAQRSGASSEAQFSGTSRFGLYVGGQSWDTMSWGNASLAFQASSGSAGENTAQPLLVDFRGQLATGTSDSLILRNFTVVRHPAQSNP